MSVINNVLKDLENRSSGFTPIEITALEPQPVARRDRKPLLIGMLLFILVAAAGWIYLQQRPWFGANAAISTIPSAGAALEVTSPQPPAAAVAEDVVRNQIVGLQLRESEQEMRMEFVLREKVLAYLRERGENSFGYHLRQVESRIVAPAITDNRWIRDLRITPAGGGVDVDFSTESDILVETRQILVDGEPVWAIKLRKAEPPLESKPPVELAALAPVAAGATADIVAAPPAPLTISEAAPSEAAARAESVAAPFAEVETPVVRLEIRSTNPNIESVNQLEYAVDLIRTGRSADAENLLQGLLDGNEDYRARKHLLVLYNRQKRADRFARLLQESMIRYPQDQLFRTEHARALFQQAAYRAVIRLFADQATLDAAQRSLLAASHQRLDQHEDAIRHYRLALELDAANARNWIGLGISQEHAAALEEALNSYQRAVGLGTLNARLRDFADRRSATLLRVLN